MPLLVVVLAAVLLFLAVFLGALGAVTSGGSDALCQPGPDDAAAKDIPPAYLALYQKAGTKYGIAWNVLAAIGDTESDHGRGPGPGIRSGTNAAGAAGPMQFMPGTWRAYAVDGNGDGRKNIYDPADAIPSAARLLKANGAPERMERALFHYNHANWYVKKVLRRAAEYARNGDASACAGGVVPPSGRAGLAVRAALRWIGTPYSWGGGGPGGPSEGFGRGNGIVGFDCSSLVQHAWHKAGISIARTSQEQWRTLPHVPAGQEQPGDLVFFTGSGGSRTAPGHVGLVVGRGRMIEAPRTGLRVRVATIGTRSDLVGYARPVQRR
ncbi:NlpC/P60 family protein [Actinomadura sp. 21ATH]|uniref:NlpC/P60 family protein n=1 Tax=Actinomadura sp. 21ATH TaxID=1735444 RepID=UPI0035BF8EE1